MHVYMRMYNAHLEAALGDDEELAGMSLPLLHQGLARGAWAPVCVHVYVHVYGHVHMCMCLPLLHQGLARGAWAPVCVYVYVHVYGHVYM